jgi:hypothetical protein
MSTINFEEIREQINRMKAGDKPDPQQPLYRAPPERKEYPVDALMDLQAPVEALQYKNGAPIVDGGWCHVVDHGAGHPAAL